MGCQTKLKVAQKSSLSQTYKKKRKVCSPILEINRALWQHWSMPLLAAAFSRVGERSEAVKVFAAGRPKVGWVAAHKAQACSGLRKTALRTSPQPSEPADLVMFGARIGVPGAKKTSRPPSRTDYCTDPSRVSCVAASSYRHYRRPYQPWTVTQVGSERAHQSAVMSPAVRLF